MQGLTIFKQKCASCHPEPLFTDFSFRNNGLEILNDDIGHGRISLRKEDDYKFKVPSLRNIALTYPYMHDGRFRSLHEVLNHYSDHAVMHDNVDPLLISQGKAGIRLTETEKINIIAFCILLLILLLYPTHYIRNKMKIIFKNRSPFP